MPSRQALVCSYYVPQPDSDSGARRLFDLICFLRDADWSVDFLASNGVGDSRDARLLQQRGVGVHDGRKTAVGKVLGLRRFDLALLASWPVAEFYLPVLRAQSPGTRVIADSLDLHFLRDARRVLHRPPGASADDGPRLLDDEYASQMLGELNAYVAADAVMTVSAKEADLLGDFTGGAAVPGVVPDCEDMRPSPRSFGERRGILTLGSYQHPPNVESLDYLCREILPRVSLRLLARHPVYVVGTGLDETARRRAASSPNVHVVGWVPSVQQYFELARISVVPLRYGAGTKRKMIQALMSGTPTVTTSVGAEGLDLRDGEHALIADDPAAFATSVERLLTDEALWERLARQGRAHVLPTHGRDAARARFSMLIEAALVRPAKGPMLAPCSQERHWGRINYQYYQKVVPSIRRVVDSVVPSGATVIIASEGSRELLRLGDRTVWHFPRTEDGLHRAEDFSDAVALMNHVDSLRGLGAEWFVLPDKLLGQMLAKFPDFKERMGSRYRVATEDAGVCLIYSLNAAPVGSAGTIPAAAYSSYSVSGARPVSVNPAPVNPAPVNPAPVNPAPLNVSRAAELTRLIAFYLPQFHPILENDCWWGEGFTEWRNVAKAGPLFQGHYQPHLPADLGFYDLRLAETRQAQADLACRYGIHGFCYYHYWFNGKQLLGRPFDEVLASGRPDFPFCLAWANEPWTRKWDGVSSDVLQPQSYSAEDDAAHIRWLIPALTDPRAVTIQGKPVFIVYQGKELPPPARTTDLWRREAERAGLKGLYLMAVETGWDAGWDATAVGFDAKVLFQPQFSILGGVERHPVENTRLRVYDYQRAWPVLANPDPVSYRRYETVFPGWDNTARRGEDGWVVHNSTPEAYEQWLSLAVQRAQEYPRDERVVFINAWNEWAEGCHLEPDQRNGSAYLEATGRALVSGSAAGKPPAGASKESRVVREGLITLP